MKIITIISCFVLGFCVSSAAQDKKTFVDYREPGALLSKSPTDNFFKLLDKKKMEELDKLEKKCNEELAKFKVNSKMDDGKRILEMQKLIDQKNNKLSKILNRIEFETYMSFVQRITVPNAKTTGTPKQ